MEHKTIYSLYYYAFCGDENFFMNFLKQLSFIAEKEVWYSSNENNLDILKFYILNIFEQSYINNLIVEENDCSIFNTGLLTPNQEEIYGFFIKNQKENSQEWYFKGFFSESDRNILHNFSKKPELVSFIKNNNDLYFDTNKKIYLNIDHILDDNWDRFDEEIKSKGKFIVQSLVYNAFEHTIKKLKRNNRLALLQFFHDQIMYLLPIEFKLSENNSITMALAVEKLPTGHYRGNTLLTLPMCYARARLVMKLDDCWLKMQ